MHGFTGRAIGSDSVNTKILYLAIDVTHDVCNIYDLAQSVFARPFPATTQSAVQYVRVADHRVFRDRFPICNPQIVFLQTFDT